MYANYQKRESNANKKRSFVRVSLEYRTLKLLASRPTNWANVTLDTSVLQIKIFNVMNVRKLLKKRK